MEVMSLICGHNGTGFSTAIHIEKYLSNKQEKEIQNSILINAGDGLVRFLTGIPLSCRVKLTKVNYIILTSLAPHNTSGLPGLLLSLSSAGVGKITLIGPMGVAGLYGLMTLFVNRRYPEVTLVEIGSEKYNKSIEVVEDEYLKLTIFPIKQKENSIAVYGLAVSISRKEVHKDSKTYPSVSVAPYTQAFTTDPEISTLLPIFASEKRSPVVYLFPLTCRDVTHNQLLKATIEAICKQCGITAIIHEMALSPDVYEFPQSQVNIAAYSGRVQHLFPEVMGVLHTRLSQDMTNDGKHDEGIYNADGGDGSMDYELLPTCIPGSVMMAANLMKMTLQFLPAATYSSFSVGLFEYSLPRDVLNHLYQICDIKRRQFSELFSKHTPDASHPVDSTSGSGACRDNFAAASVLRAQLKSRKRPMSALITEPPGAAPVDVSFYVPPPCPDDLRVTFLGTGSASPSKHRSSSCILLQGAHQGNKSSMLLDAGEGCIAQLWQTCSGDSVRFFGVLSSVDAVWISHHHADHSMGLPALAQMLLLATTHPTVGSRDAHKKVFVICSPDLWRYYEYVLSISGLDHLVVFVDILQTLRSSCLTNELACLYASCGLVSSLLSVPVEHCRHSFGLVLELANCQKIVYSGDCRPSKALVTAGMSCDLLIHEATFDDTRGTDAVNKRHSTTSEALDISFAMRAKHTVLTHFSQRYPHVPVFSEGNTTSDFPVVSASDLLSFYFPSQIKAAATITRTIVQMSNSIEKCHTENGTSSRS